MNEVTIRRSDIYLATLTGGENILRGIHPVLIISCKKFNSCTTLINVIPITSTIKGNALNIPIGTESGLLHNSELLCGQIQTINQKHLMKKVGFARQELMDEVMRTLVKQFSGKYNELDIAKREKLEIMIGSIKKLISFKVKYNIIDVEIDSQIEQSISDVKSYCNQNKIEYKNWFNLEIFKVYQEKRREIRIARGMKDIDLTVELSRDYLKYLRELEYEECTSDICLELEWANYNYALALKKQGHINESYAVVKQALLFSTDDDSNRALINWLIGECCSLKEAEYKQEGIEAFNKCIDFYRKVGERKYELLCRFNLAKILGNLEDMENYMIAYKSTQFKNVLHDFGDMQISEVIAELKKEINTFKN